MKLVYAPKSLIKGIEARTFVRQLNTDLILKQVSMALSQFFLDAISVFLPNGEPYKDTILITFIIRKKSTTMGTTSSCLAGLFAW